MTTETRFTKLLQATPEQLGQIDALLDGQGLGIKEPTDRKLLTLTDCAEVLGISRQTVWRMIADGRLPTIEVRQGRHRVASSAITAFLKGVNV